MPDPVICRECRKKRGDWLAPEMELAGNGFWGCNALVDRRKDDISIKIHDSPPKGCYHLLEQAMAAARKRDA